MPLTTEPIRNRQDFVEFLHRLLADYRQNGHQWENQRLSDFLEALSRYAEDIDGYYHNTTPAGETPIDADQASWQVFADMLSGATIYE